MQISHLIHLFCCVHTIQIDLARSLHPQASHLMYPSESSQLALHRLLNAKILPSR